MEIFMIDVARGDTSINTIFVEEGKFVPLKRIEGTFREQAEQIAHFTLKKRLQKVIVDTTGVGQGLLESLVNEMASYGITLQEDATVVYN